MSVPYETIVEEDIRVGRKSDTPVPVTMPGGGTANGTPVSLATFQDDTGELYADLPTAAEGKGQLRHISDSTTKTQGATAAGGGTYFVLLWSNGTNWLVVVGY